MSSMRRPFPKIRHRDPISQAREACHGESKTQGEGNQSKNQKNQN